MHKMPGLSRGITSVSKMRFLGQQWMDKKFGDPPARMVPLSPPLDSLSLPAFIPALSPARQLIPGSKRGSEKNHIHSSDTQCWRREEQAEALLLPDVARSQCVSSGQEECALVPGHLGTLPGSGRARSRDSKMSCMPEGLPVPFAWHHASPQALSSSSTS